MFKFLVDEDMPRPTTGLLRSLDIDAIDARDREFGNILKYPLGSHCGIIVARFPYTFVRCQILDTIRKFFVDVEKSKLPNNLTILEVGKYRIRTA